MADTAREWRRFFETESRAKLMRPLILESWQRSYAAAIDTAPSQITFHRVAEDDLERRRARRASLIKFARPHIEWLSSNFAGISHVAYLTDEDAVVLLSAGDEELCKNFGLAPGYQWSETLMGTNGAGTALVEDRPVAVFGDEHYIEAFRSCTCTAAPIHDAAGQVVGAIDITSAVKDAGPERLSLVAHVAFVIEQQLKLEADRLEALEQNLRKDDFLAVLAHELRGPISAISSAAQIFQARCQDDPLLSQTGKIVERQSRLLSLLVSDLLDVARVSKGRIELNRQMIDVRDCVTAALEGHQAFVDNKQQVVELDMPAPAVVRADQTRLTEMVSNLISNASRYSPNGSRITITVRQQAQKLSITVRDSGSGIDQSTIARLFEPFVCGRAGSGEGLGIGLWLTRRFAELHGGSVTAHSAGPGKGAEFRIDLPVDVP
ncbi:MAG: ATP-binding protein [Rhodospirillaceae bacterium]